MGAANCGTRRRSNAKGGGFRSACQPHGSRSDEDRSLPGCGWPALNATTAAVAFDCCAGTGEESPPGRVPIPVGQARANRDSWSDRMSRQWIWSGWMPSPCQKTTSRRFLLNTVTLQRLVVIQIEESHRELADTGSGKESRRRSDSCRHTGCICIPPGSIDGVA